MKSTFFIQYCEYGPDPARCYEWMKSNLPGHYARLVGGGMLKLCSHREALKSFILSTVGNQMEELSLGDSKRQTRGMHGSLTVI